MTKTWKIRITIILYLCYCLQARASLEYKVKQKLHPKNPPNKPSHFHQEHEQSESQIKLHIKDFDNNLKLQHNQNHPSTAEQQGYKPENRQNFPSNSKNSDYTKDSKLENHLQNVQAHPGNDQSESQKSRSHHDSARNNVLHKDIQDEKVHMKEHMDVPIDTSNMSEQELQFHYFKMHDSDGNNKLDGCELVKSLIHWHDSSNHDPKSGQPVPEEKIFKDDELVAMIDPILETDDKNKDGYIDYSEFVIAQQAAQAQAKQ